MAIKINRVAATAAMTWLSRAWQLFQQQSGLWMQSMFFIVVLATGSSLIGDIGSVVFMLIYPFLMAGFYHMVYQADNGLPSEFSSLFVGFKDGRIRRVMLQFILINLLLSIPSSVLMSHFMEGIMASGLNAEGATVADLDMSGVEWQESLLFVVIGVLHTMLVYFAVPVIYFHHEQNLLTILKLSFKGCWENILPLMVFAILVMGLMFIGIATLGLALVVILPLLAIAYYLSFNDIIVDDMPIIDEDLNKSKASASETVFIV